MKKESIGQSTVSEQPEGARARHQEDTKLPDDKRAGLSPRSIPARKKADDDAIDDEEKEDTRHWDIEHAEEYRKHMRDQPKPRRPSQVLSSENGNGKIR